MAAAGPPGLTPPVEHPWRPGVWGVFLPYTTAATWSSTGWIAVPYIKESQAHGCLSQELLDYLAAHEFNVERPFEVIQFNNLLGWGYFYVDAE